MACRSVLVAMTSKWLHAESACGTLQQAAKSSLPCVRAAVFFSPLKHHRPPWAHVSRQASLNANHFAVHIRNQSTHRTTKSWSQNAWQSRKHTLTGLITHEKHNQKAALFCNMYTSSSWKGAASSSSKASSTRAATRAHVSKSWSDACVAACNKLAGSILSCSQYVSVRRN